MARRISANAWTWGIVAAALVLRLSYLASAQVVNDVVGDIQQYVAYAENLIRHGVYSSVINAVGVPPPDAYRPPGYPLFLVSAMLFGGESWIGLAKVMQILLSTATVGLVALLGREWLRPAWANAGAALLAFWPHHIVFASTLLSETVFGFLLTLAMYLWVVAVRRSSWRIAVGGGVAFGLASLVNPLVAVLPLVLAAVLLAKREHRLALAAGVSFLVLPLVWMLAAPVSPPELGQGSRLAINFVQGSWPHYHLAWRTQQNNEMSRAIMATIDDESRSVIEDPAVGLAGVRDRLFEDPAFYASWYALHKPVDLWAWDIQLGWRGIYFLDTPRSPFERNPLLRAMTAVFKAANPWLTLAACLGVVWCLVSWVRGRTVPFGLFACATFAVYVTAVHVVLQAEPRYAIPYRGIEALLAVYAISLVAGWAVARQAATRQAAVVGTEPV